MNLPQIDLSSLPGLDHATGLFGSVSDVMQAGFDDRIIILMVFIYDLLPPPPA